MHTEPSARVAELFSPVTVAATPALDVLLFDLDDTLAATAHLEDCRQAPKDVIRACIKDLTPFHGLPAVFRALQSTTRLGVVTASPGHYTKLLLEKLLPDVFWDVIVTGSDIKLNGLRPKPYPDGINLALEKLGNPSKRKVAYIGDTRRDVEAAYHAGVRPVLALWAHRDVPLNSQLKPWRPFDPFNVREVGKLAQHFRLQADTLLWRPEELSRYRIDPDAFLSALENDEEALRVYPFCKKGHGQTVIGLALGRYYRRDGSTLGLYRDHTLSQTIREKDDQPRPFEAPERWAGAVAALVEHYVATRHVDLITVIPAKSGRDPRLERFLNQVQTQASLPTAVFRDALLKFSDDAVATKALAYKERRQTAFETLSVSGVVKNLRVLVIDDVITSGSTLAAAQAKLLRAGAKEILFLALARTVSSSNFEVDPDVERLCPLCGLRLRMQQNRQDGSSFWGCTGYNQKDRSGCRYTEDAR